MPDFIDETIWYQDIGKRIRDARNEMGLTQQDLADQADLKRSSIANIEKSTQKTTIYTIYKLSILLKKPLAELLPDVPEAAKVVIGGKESILSPKAKAALDELIELGDD